MKGDKKEMKKTVKKLKLKKEVKGYLLMILATVYNITVIIAVADTLASATALFLYNFVICLLILAIANDKK